ncbi:hypothetical protein P3T76_003841 [Phytophthora citrophthora]|uniref:HNH nuclease domain-containing protein n=1 Tax=Phytophthora citrophthora TaxID=4793 RepID=A0AAD9LPU9_9STRA|nr:hypothetical protein P3T76_003841 [Phytophthora citrophthora]
MRLFLARKDDTAWLKEMDLIKMRKGEISSEDESCYMKEELEAVTDKVYEKFPNTIPDGSIHVLVAVSGKEESSEEKAFGDSSAMYVVATSRLLEFTFLNVSSTTPSQAQTMKEKLVEAYKCDCREENENGESMLLCIVMDIALPSSVVIGSHIFRRACAPLQDWIVGIDNVDYTRNGLLLFKPIKSSMDNLDIAFLDNQYDQFTLKVFNPSIKAGLLVDWLTDEQWEALGLDSLPTGWKNSERPLSAL